MTSKQFSCVLQCGKQCDVSNAIDKLGQEVWEKLKCKALSWKGLDRFGNVFETVDWDAGPTGKHMHTNCRIDFSSSEKLNRSKIRQQKRESESSVSGSDDIEMKAPEPKRLRSSVGIVHDKNLCVWCMKPEDTKHPDRKGKWLLISYLPAWNMFRKHTIALEDDIMRERINRLIDSTTDPFSTEIRYHHKCWLKYVVAYQKMSIEDQPNLLQNVEFREAQTLFIEHVRQVIYEDHEVRTLQGFLRDYKSIVGTYGFPTASVKSSYVKEILSREFGMDIGFHVRHQKNQSEVVYDAKGCVSYLEATIYSLGISSEQLVDNVANRLRSDIKETPTIPWPPQVAELEQEEHFPPLLLQLLSSLKKSGPVTPDARARALVSMIAYYVTGRPTTTTINLSMNLHGLTRSKELVDTFHKFGVGIGYASVLLLRDAWALHDIEQCGECPNEIAENIPGVIVVDNDDFRNDTLTGGDTSHRTNVMYVQPVSLEFHDSLSDKRIKDVKALSTSLKEKAAEMKSHDRYITHKRGEPAVIGECVQPEVLTTESQRKRGVIHTLVRANGACERPSDVEQTVPSFAGFQSLISASVAKSKPYYFMTYPDPPKKAVLNDVLVKVNATIERKRMPFAIVVGDQPVYTLLVEIKSEHPQKFEQIIPFLGPFHTQCSMIYAIYKRHKGSGIAEVLVAAGVIAEGSVDQALRGKHYRRALRCLTLMYEALMHLILNKYHAESQLDAPTLDRLAILRDPKTNSQGSLATAYKELEDDPAIDGLINSTFEKIEKTDMAKYWLDFMTMVEILMMNVYAVHTCNWKEFLISLRQMMPWMMIYDQVNYGRWLPHFWAMLSSLPPDQTKFFSSSFSQSITGKPYSSIPWDMWIEMTMNKGSKLKAGWLSILRNEKQLMTDTRNANNLGRIRIAVHNQVNKQQLNRTHTECAPTRMRKDERAVQDIISCIEEYDCFPFDPAAPILRTLQSAIPAPVDVVRDFTTAKQDGESKLKEFMDERVYSKHMSVHDRIKRHSRLTFVKASANKSAKVLKVKQGEMENRALASVVNLVENSGIICLSDIMKHRITEECLALFTAEGTFRKTQKSKILEKFIQQPIEVASYIALVDMGMIWRLASPTVEDREKNDGSVYTWSDYANKITSMIIARHAAATTIICINDPYDHIESIKDDERELRIQGQGCIPNVYMKPSDKFPSPRDFKTFLCSGANKKRLQALIKSQLSNVARSIDKVLLYSVGVECVNLSSDSVEQDLTFDHCEADTIILSFYKALRAAGNNDPVVIDAADTDVYVQAAAISHDLPGILCIKKKSEFLFCRSMCKDEDICKCIIQFHVITGCDATSCFYGHGKATLYAKMAKNAKAQDILSRCGESLPLKEDVLNDLVIYVIRYVYGDVRSLSLEMARVLKWKGQKKKSMMRLPPDFDSLKEHIKRANYLAYIQRHPELRVHPSPIGHGWELVNGRCKPVRHTQPSLPLTLSTSLIQEVGYCSDSDDESDLSDAINSDLDISSDDYD